MAKRNARNLRVALELWARWCDQGGVVPTTGRSMLAKLIDNKGELFFGGSGGSGGPPDALEARIEAAVVAMSASDPMSADVLRLESDAGWWHVVKRRSIHGYDPAGIGRFEKADALGISLATYKRRLSEALDIIETLLG